MIKNLLLACAVVVVAGCGDDANNNNDMGGGNNPDLSMSGNADLTGNPDLLPACVTNPMTTVDFLNSCHSASVDQVDITPFYPTLAPGGVLPALP